MQYKKQKIMNNNKKIMIKNKNPQEFNSLIISN